MKLPRAWICSHCHNVDDLEPHPKTGASRRCPCPHDEVTARQRQIEVEIRHRAATAIARERARWQAFRERNAS